MNRFEKIQYLLETCSQDFLNKHLLNELVAWMGEDDFDQFFSKLCSNWGIAETPEQLQQLIDQDDE